MTIRVNGREISRAALLAEMQLHPAATLDDAVVAAREALIVRELLIQRAEALGKEWDRDDPEEEERIIDEVVRADVAEPPVPTEAECRRWYEANPQRFRVPALYEAAHILYLAPRDHEEARASARARAEAALARLKVSPEAFEDIARAESQCSSAGEGGRLGQVARGETCEEIDSVLAGLEEGQICPMPIESAYGVHILRLDRRIAERVMPFAVAQPAIATELRRLTQRRAIAQYIALLAGEAEIEGATIKRAMSPLVQ